MCDVSQTVKTMSELTFKSLPAAAKTIFITDITEYGAARVATCSCSLSGCWEFWSVQSSGWEQPITWVGSTFVHWSLCFKWSCYFWLLHGLGSFESGRTMPPAHKQDSVPLRIFTESTGSTAPTYTFELGYRRSFTCRGLLPTWDLKKRNMGKKEIQSAETQKTGQRQADTEAADTAPHTPPLNDTL